jgi:hypothetical protein
VLEYDRELLLKSGIQQMPTSFQPDLVSETCQRAAPGGTLQPADPALPACRVRALALLLDCLVTRLLFWGYRLAAGPSGTTIADKLTGASIAALLQVSSEFYLTRVRPQRGYVDANIRPELQPFLRLGRPDLDQQFIQMKADALMLREQRVAVAVCGPVCMVDAVRRCCNRHSGGGVVFDLHTEVFEF